MNSIHRVVVLGAGYAGLNAATRLARHLKTNRDPGTGGGGEPDPMPVRRFRSPPTMSTVSVTLVNASADFVERPRLHQVAAGQDVAVHPLAPIIGDRGVELLVGYARAIDTEAKTVTVSTDDDVTDLAYDTLVYALGSRIDVETVPGIAANAHILGDVADSRGLHEALPDSGTVVVCGGGLTGIEAACELAEARPGLTVRLVSRGEPGGWLSPAAKKHVDAALARLGVEVTAGVSIAEIAEGHLVTEGGGRIDFDACVWAGGFSVPELAASAGLAVDAAGRAIVDDHLRSVSHPEVYVIGDAAALPGTWGESLSYGCRVAGFMGPYAADTIAAGLAARPAPAFKFRYIHQCVSLGRKDAVIQFVHAGDESPRSAVLRGRVAVWYKDLVLNSAVWLFRNPGPYLPHRKVRPVAV